MQPCPMVLNRVIKTKETMNKKEITIAGTTYPIDFTMQAIMTFEEIADKSFFDTNFQKTTDRMALIYAAVMNADKKADITIEKIAGSMDLQAIQDIIAAFGTVMNLANEFFKLPKVTEDEDKANEPKEGDEKPKN